MRQKQHFLFLNNNVWSFEMFSQFIGIGIFLTATNILAYDNIIPKLTNDCPFGYKTSINNYCIPIDSSNYKYVVPKLSNTCPFGFYNSGSSGYCATDNKTIPEPIKKIGENCPSGYHTDGSSGYCKLN